MVSRRIGFKINGVIHPFISPQARHRDHSVVDFTQIAQVLPTHVSHVGSSFAISMLINDQHSMGSRCRQWIFKHHLQPLALELSFIPVRFDSGTIAETALADLALLPQAPCWLALSMSCCALRVRVTPPDSDETLPAGSTSQRGYQTASDTLQEVL